MDTKQTVTVTYEQLTKNLLRAIRKGHKKHKQNIVIEAKIRGMQHSWDRFGGHCKDCGVSAYDVHTDECPAKD